MIIVGSLPLFLDGGFFVDIEGRRLVVIIGLLASFFIDFFVLVVVDAVVRKDYLFEHVKLLVTIFTHFIFD